jgi:hypothetical protein
MSLENEIKIEFRNEKPIYKLPEDTNIGLIYNRRKGEDRRGKNNKDELYVNKNEPQNYY